MYNSGNRKYLHSISTVLEKVTKINISNTILYFPLILCDQKMCDKIYHHNKNVFKLVISSLQ